MKCRFKGVPYAGFGPWFEVIPGDYVAIPEWAVGMETSDE